MYVCNPKVKVTVRLCDEHHKRIEKSITDYIRLNKPKLPKDMHKRYLWFYARMLRFVQDRSWKYLVVDETYDYNLNY